MSWMHDACLWPQKRATTDNNKRGLEGKKPQNIRMGSNQTHYEDSSQNVSHEFHLKPCRAWKSGWGPIFNWFIFYYRWKGATCLRLFSLLFIFHHNIITLSRVPLRHDEENIFLFLGQSFSRYNLESRVQRGNWGAQFPTAEGIRYTGLKRSPTQRTFIGRFLT